MYRKFYHLRKAPFQMTVDPEFFWTGDKYARALEAMRYGLEHKGGLTLLTGESGTGKTAVAQALFHLLDGRQVLSAMIPDPCRTEEEFFNLVLAALGIPERVQERQSFHDHLRSLLEKTGGQGRQVLLVIDEAQRLSSGVVREIDAMLDLPPGPAGGLSICLVGRLQDSRGLMELITDVFSEKVTVTYRVTPLTEEETAAYVLHRLEVAGAGSGIFTGEALREVHRCTRGYPGLINGLCDFALFSGHNMGLAEIGAEVVLRSGASLRLAGEEQEHDTTEEADDGPTGNGITLAGASGEGESGRENTAGEEISAAATGGAGREPGRSPDSAVAGMPETTVRRGRFAAISSFGALAAVALLVGGALYYRHSLDAAWTPPAEPPSAGPPVPVAEAPQPGVVQGVPAVKTVPSASGQDLRETVSAGEKVEPQASSPSPLVAPALSGTNVTPPAGMEADAGAAETTAVPEKSDAGSTPAAGPARPPVADDVAQQSPGTPSGERAPVAVTAGQEPAAEDSGPAPAETATAPVSGPGPEKGEPARPAEPLSPALKALLAGGSLAGDPAIRRLPDVRINSSPGRSRLPEVGRGESEPDPAQVIDWLLKKKAGNDTSR